MAQQSTRITMRGLMTPECNNLSKSTKVSFTVVLVLTALALIILVSGAGVWYLMANDAGGTTSNPEKKKETVLKALGYTAVALNSLCVLIGLWGYSVLSQQISACAPTNV